MTTVIIWQRRRYHEQLSWENANKIAVFTVEKFRNILVDKEDMYSTYISSLNCFH